MCQYGDANSSSNWPLQKYHNIPSCSLFVTPKFCISIVFSFSWELKWPQEKLKTMFMQNLGWQTKSIIICYRYHIFWSGQLAILEGFFLRIGLGVLRIKKKLHFAWESVDTFYGFSVFPLGFWEGQGAFWLTFLIVLVQQKKSICFDKLFFFVPRILGWPSKFSVVS